MSLFYTIVKLESQNLAGFDNEFILCVASPFFSRLNLLSVFDRFCLRKNCLTEKTGFSIDLLNDMVWSIHPLTRNSQNDVPFQPPDNLGSLNRPAAY